MGQADQPAALDDASAIFVFEVKPPNAAMIDQKHRQIFGPDGTVVHAQRVAIRCTQHPFTLASPCALTVANAGQASPNLRT